MSTASTRRATTYPQKPSSSGRSWSRTQSPSATAWRLPASRRAQPGSTKAEAVDHGPWRHVQIVGHQVLVRSLAGIRRSRSRCSSSKRTPSACRRVSRPGSDGSSDGPELRRALAPLSNRVCCSKSSPIMTNLVSQQRDDLPRAHHGRRVAAPRVAATRPARRPAPPDLVPTQLELIGSRLAVRARPVEPSGSSSPSFSSSPRRASSGAQHA